MTMTRQLRVAALGLGLLAAVTSGCLGATDVDESTSSTALRFAGPDDFMNWLGNEATGRTGVTVSKNAAGQVDSVAFTTTADRDALIADLTARGPIMIGSDALRLDELPAEPADQPTASEGLAVRTSAVTTGLPPLTFAATPSNSFMIEGGSTNDHYSIFGVGYHRVGGRTKIWKGGAISCTWVGQALCDQHFNSKVSLTVANTYFSNQNSCAPGNCPAVPMAIRSEFVSQRAVNEVERHLTAFGRLILGCDNGFGPGECYIDGVCTSHSGFSITGEFLQTVTTAKGSYDCT
jgi:hypothetical protein